MSNCLMSIRKSGCFINRQWSSWGLWSCFCSCHCCAFALCLFVRALVWKQQWQDNNTHLKQLIWALNFWDVKRAQYTGGIKGGSLFDILPHNWSEFYKVWLTTHDLCTCDRMLHLWQKKKEMNNKTVQMAWWKKRTESNLVGKTDDVGHSAV